VTVQQIYRDHKESLLLELLVGLPDEDVPVVASDVHRPGMALMGYAENVLPNRIQVLGESEMAFLNTLSADEQRSALERVMGLDPPVIVIAAVEPAPVEEVAEAAEPDPVVTEIAEPDVAEPVTPEEPAPVEVVKLEEPAKIEVVKPGPVKVPVLIEAAEVEGDNVFIAGSGQPGTIVQLYMDGKHIGSAEIGNEGAFLFEGTGGLKAGRYAVRADMVDKKTATVIARAEVSLLHEPVVVKPVEVASLENEPVEPAPEPVVAATKPVVEPVVVPVSEPVAETQAVVTPIEPKPEVTSKVEPAPQTAKPQIVTVAEPQVKEVTKVLEIVAAEPAAPSQVTQVAVADPVETPEPIIKEPVIKEIVTGSSVIIRRGDNLWRVSRRKWGQGIRYTVIFEANREQIRDPHWIYPGQVFKIPKIASDEESSQAG